MEKGKQNRNLSPVEPTIQVFKHEGEQEWQEQRSLQELSDEEYYDLWEGDRV
ncbi:hypothetical protein [Ammoniphilus sp. CFH 90114]|uniref:hypothetical protein n=1 Tax=Ammoniphilus sp. CFH 90114 TaxID=2493665 RepID=UPI0013E928DF|nr:hypothetical protein [Ammoniphilus sp. CFH 90114]